MHEVSLQLANGMAIFFTTRLGYPAKVNDLEKALWHPKMSKTLLAAP